MFSTYPRLHVDAHASPRTVIRAARQRLTQAAQRDPIHREERKRFYRSMLAHHATAHEMMTAFRLS